MNRKSKKKLIFVVIFLIILGIGGVLIWKFGNRNIEINNPGENTEENSEQDEGVSSITGEKCENYNRRPIAVMLAEDPITRPLSGIAEADLVIEMPVITGSITRMMAVFQCGSPEEIGSVRSARHDFIPLALGLDAIYAHWGGSHFALDKLDTGIIDNLDAMINPYNSFFRKSGIIEPHNGFSSMDRLLNAAQKLGYRSEDKFSGYPHVDDSDSPVDGQKGRLIIGYGNHYKVYYDYDPEENVYRRWRDSQREIDKNSGNQVKASVVIIMKAESRMIEPPNYNEVDVEGEGEAIIYQNGGEIKGYWKKEGSYSKSKLQFLDKNGEEIKFVPGKIWIEVSEQGQDNKWELL
jgi:hypothetical protein